MLASSRIILFEMSDSARSRDSCQEIFGGLNFEHIFTTITGRATGAEAVILDIDASIQ